MSLTPGNRVAIYAACRRRHGCRAEQHDLLMIELDWKAGRDIPGILCFGEEDVNVSAPAARVDIL